MIMCDKSRILEFEGKKIWIKRIDGNLYCVNGRYVEFSEKQDLSDAFLITELLDEFYNPFYDLKQLKNPATVLVCNYRQGEFSVNLRTVDAYVNYSAQIRRVADEYKAWLSDVNNNDLYVSCYVGDDLEAWFRESKAKFARYSKGG